MSSITVSFITDLYIVTELTMKIAMYFDKYLHN